MKTAMWLVFVLLVVATTCVAQVSPRPVADAEMRDNNSIRMRSIQLERAKRDSNSILPSPTSKEQIIKLAEIKEDFENIQRLQDAIIKTYKTGKTIDYAKIGETAANITKKARRLDVNLFGSETDGAATKEKSPSKTKTVRDLIIELDKAIALFVNSPVFDSGKVVDTELAAKTENDLQKVIKLSHDLSVESRKQP